MHDHDHQHDDLAWQAFRYVSGEQDAAEEEHFAALLAEDQAAREAVARAYELAQATALAFDVGPIADVRPSRSGAGRARWAWVAVAAAACVLVALGVAQLQHRDLPAASLKTAALADQWSEMREQVAEPQWRGDQWQGDQWQGESPVADDWMNQQDETVASDVEPAIAPEWMLAAVSEQHGMSGAAGGIEARSEESQEQ